jgi:hypothetical protein
MHEPTDNATFRMSNKFCTVHRERDGFNVLLYNFRVILYFLLMYTFFHVEMNDSQHRTHFDNICQFILCNVLLYKLFI